MNSMVVCEDTNKGVKGIKLNSANSRIHQMLSQQQKRPPETGKPLHTHSTHQKQSLLITAVIVVVRVAVITNVAT
jgi:hypothetical protein